MMERAWRKSLTDPERCTDVHRWNGMIRVVCALESGHRGKHRANPDKWGDVSW